MNGTDDAVRARRASALLAAACTALALANLPGDDLPPTWLLAFVLPGALLAWLGRWTPRPWQRALTAAALQTGACWLALELAGPMSRPAALACTILPPLGFATARRHAADQSLALFLSFCVVLVGVVLDGVHVPLLAAWTACACLALRCADHLALLASGRRVRRVNTSGPGRTVFAGAVPLVVASLFAALALERTLGWLPAPSRGGAQPASDTGGASGPRRVGLDDAFVLGGRGALAGLTGEQLVRVHAPDGTTVPRDLYLRSGFFTTPSLQSWELGPLDAEPPSHDDGHTVRRPLAPAPVHTLELERYAGARNFVFVPPGTTRVFGIPDLTVDPQREWIRQTRARDTGPYRVEYQPGGTLPPPRRLDPRGEAFGLLALPRNLDVARYEGLLDRWQVGRGAADAAAARIAAGLAAHCRYDRIEPPGPFTTTLDNFLFAPHDRRGYCMHFASAAALLLRLRGVPCRIGVGLYGGTVARDDPAARIYGSQHAHAWVEIPYEQRGYVVFDPTPPPERGQATPTQHAAGDLGDAPAAAAAGSSTTWRTMLDVLLQPWLLAALLTLLLARSVWQREPVAAPPPLPPVARSARRLLAKLLQQLHTAGLPRHGRTLEIFARALHDDGVRDPAIAAAFAAYQQVRFGGHPFDADRERRLRLGIAAAQALPRAGAPVPQDTAGSRQSI